MKGVFKRSAEQTKKDFFQIYSSDKIKGLFREINLDRSTDLSKMSDADLEKAMGVLRRKGGTEGEGAASTAYAISKTCSWWERRSFCTGFSFR